MEKKQIFYYQYHLEYDYPLFLKSEGLSEKVNEFLLEMKFRELKGHEEDQVEKIIAENPKARLLSLGKASSKVSLQINNGAYSDRYGNESLFEREAYKVYRYRGIALMIYSPTAQYWECGVTDLFASSSLGKAAAKSVLNRFLTFALLPLGVVGFWGKVIDEGILLLNQRDSQSQAIFIDLSAEKLLSEDGVRKGLRELKIIRSDDLLNKEKRGERREVKMDSSELLGLLLLRTTFFDSQGTSAFFRQLVQKLPIFCEGITISYSHKKYERLSLRGERSKT